MKTFKNFLTEKSKVKTNISKTRDQHDRQKADLRAKQQKDMQKARLLDLQKKETERAKKEAERNLKKNVSEDIITVDETKIDVFEYLEDGTLKLVQAYKKATPGQ